MPLKSTPKYRINLSLQELEYISESISSEHTQFGFDLYTKILKQLKAIEVGLKTESYVSVSKNEKLNSLESSGSGSREKHKHKHEYTPEELARELAEMEKAIRKIQPGISIEEWNEKYPHDQRAPDGTTIP
jgi:hypothetical protein